MNLVEQIARMIDAEGAYSEGFPSTSAAAALPATPRQKYFRAKYEMQAIDILKVAASMTPAEIKAALIEFEKQGWKRLGIPLDKLPEADAIIAAKYA